MRNEIKSNICLSSKSLYNGPFSGTWLINQTYDLSPVEEGGGGGGGQARGGGGWGGGNGG